MSKKQDTINLLSNLSSMVETHGLSNSIYNLISNIGITLEAIKSDTDTGINESNNIK